MINLSSRQLRIIQWIGFPAFFVCCYFFFLALTFPAERFLPIAEAKLTEVLGREVTITDLSISPFGSVSLTGVAIEVPKDEDELRKTGNLNKTVADDKGDAGGDTDSDGKAGAAPKVIVPRYHIDEMNVRVGIWSLIFGDLDVEVDADFLGGNILVKYKAPLASDEEEEAEDDAEELAKLSPAERVKRIREQREMEKAAAAAGEVEPGNEVAFSVVATGLNLIQFWDLKDLLPLPMFGTLDFGIELKTATGKMANAEGKMWVEGREISLGEGQSKIEVIEGMGPMTVDAFAIQSLALEMNVNEGKCSFGKVNLASNDLAATAQGDIQFADPISLSRLNLYFTFKLLDGYAQKSPTAQTLVSLMPGALSAAQRTDGYYGYGYRGTFKTARLRPQKFFNTADRSQRAPISTRRSTRPTPRTSPAARSRSVSPAIPSASSRAPIVTTPPVPEPEPEPEPEMEPEPEPEPMASPPSVNMKEMSDRIQERQAESERRRMEATLKAKREIEDRAEEEEVEEPVEVSQEEEEESPDAGEEEAGAEAEEGEDGGEAEGAEGEENNEEENNEEEEDDEE